MWLLSLLFCSQSILSLNPKRYFTKNWYLEMPIWNIIFCKTLFEALFPSCFIYFTLGNRFFIAKARSPPGIVNWIAFLHASIQEEYYHMFNFSISTKFPAGVVLSFKVARLLGSFSVMARIKTELPTISLLKPTSAVPLYGAQTQAFPARKQKWCSCLSHPLGHSLHRADHGYLMACP